MFLNDVLIIPVWDVVRNSFVHDYFTQKHTSPPTFISKDPSTVTSVLTRWSSFPRRRDLDPRVTISYYS